MTFVSFGSGSSGNCYYLGLNDENKNYGILIDAGINVSTVKRFLKKINIPMSDIYAIIITHDHTDHIKYITNFGEGLNIPVYTTKAVYKGINKNKCIKEKPVNCMHFINKEEPFQIKDFKITAFDIPHDATDNMGYKIEINDSTFCFATDIGHITEKVEHYICEANYLVLEANYDENMLKTGSYPIFLKNRVSGPRGHLSNNEAAKFIVEHYQPKLKHVWLCHLSDKNNLPELAYSTIEQALNEKGIIVGKDLKLTPLKRRTPELFEF